jgi:hypothetical protein
MKTRVVTLDGIFVRNESGFYEPEHEEHIRCILCIWASLGIAAWAAFIGVGYAIWRVFEALA